MCTSADCIGQQVHSSSNNVVVLIVLAWCCLASLRRLKSDRFPASEHPSSRSISISSPRFCEWARKPKDHAPRCRRRFSISGSDKNETSAAKENTRNRRKRRSSWRRILGCLRAKDEAEVCRQRIIRINDPIADFDWRTLYMVGYYEVRPVTRALA